MDLPNNNYINKLNNHFVWKKFNKYVYIYLNVFFSNTAIVWVSDACFKFDMQLYLEKATCIQIS